MNTNESTGKMSPDEAGDRGALILGHLREIYKLVEWDDDELGYIRTTFYKSGKIELATHLDDVAGIPPTEFEMSEYEEAEAKQNGE